MDPGRMDGKRGLAAEFLPVKDIGGEGLLDLGGFCGGAHRMDWRRARF